MIRKSSQISQREHNESRIRRAESWLKLSNRSKSEDERFIFLWIAFNAAYGNEIPDDTNIDAKTPEKERFAEFVDKIVERDREGAIKKTLLETFSGPVRILLKNKFVFGPFWEWVQERKRDDGWLTKLKKRNKQAFEALGKGNVAGVLQEVLARLYVLRNQMVHGGTTFYDGWGREQVMDGSRIMKTLMPLVLQIMKDDIKKHPDSKVWGKLNYPRVGDDHPDRIPTP